MTKIQLGNSKTYISKLGLGCINFGTTTKEETAFGLLDTYVEHGGNLIDTANNYAFWNGGDGRDSERVIGHWLHYNHAKRKELVLCTKIGAMPVEPARGFDLLQGNGRQIILSEVQKSLEALQTDYIDLLYLHTDDYGTPLEETLDALAEVVQKGYVRLIGCSNFRTWRIEKARMICKSHELPFFSAVQQRNSYFKPVNDASFGLQVAADSELWDYLSYHHDLTLISHTPLLYGAYLKDTIEDPAYDTRDNRERLKFIQTQGINKIPWVLHEITDQYGGGAVLVSCNSIEHLLQDLLYFDEHQ